MTEYTPTTDDVRADYAYTSDTGEPDPAYEAAFNRWLAAHDRTTAAKALREAAEFRRERDIDHDYWADLARRKYTAGDNMTSVWLEDRAARIEQGGGGQ